MEGPPAASVERDGRWSRWLPRLISPQTGRVALVLVLLATAAFGGLDTVDKEVTPFDPGQEFSDGQYTLIIERARVVNELKGTYGKPKPGLLYLGVLVTVRNDSAVPGRLHSQLDLRDVRGAELFGIFRFRDGSPIQTLGPGLSEELVFAWQVPESTAKSLRSVTIRVWKKKYSQLKVTYGDKAWIDTDDYGQVVVPVKDSA